MSAKKTVFDIDQPGHYWVWRPYSATWGIREVFMYSEQLCVSQFGVSTPIKDLFDLNARFVGPLTAPPAPSELRFPSPPDAQVRHYVEVI